MSHKIDYEEIKKFLEADKPKIVLASSLPLKKLEVDSKGMYFIISITLDLALTTLDLKEAVNYYNKI
jgi:hypothetical protein